MVSVEAGDLKEMKYLFTCPIAGCRHTMTVEARSSNEATDNLTEKAKEHLAATHRDVKKTDQEARSDIESKMTTAGGTG